MITAVQWLQVLQSSLGDLPSPIAIVDSRGIVIATNTAWKRAEADNGAWDDTVHAPAPYLEVCGGADGPDPALHAEIAEGLTLVLSGVSSSFSYSYTTRNSVAERPFSLIISPIPPPLGGALIFHHEVARSVDAPLPTTGPQVPALQVANHAPVLIWVADTNGNCTWFNQVFQEFTGTPLSACAQWNERIHPEDRAHYEVQLSQDVSLRQHDTRAYRLRRHDGIYRWIHEHAKSVQNSDGTYAGFIATCSDVTASKDFESELKRHHDHLDRELHFAGAMNRMSQAINGLDDREQLLDSAAGILGRALAVDRSMIFDIRLSKRLALVLSEWLNPACALALSIKRDFPLELFPESLRHLWEMRSPLESHREQLNARLASEGSARLLHEGMNIHSLLWHPFDFSSDGFHLLVLNQVSQRRQWQMEERRFLGSMANLVTVALQKIRLHHEHRDQAERLGRVQQLEAMSRIARGVTLDIGQLIADLSGPVRVLAESLSDDDSNRAHVDAILAALDKARLNNNHLLAFCRPPARLGDQIELNALVQRLSGWLSGVGGDGIALVTTLTPQACLVRAEPDQLTLALMHLARNAREAMPNGGTLTITTAKQSIEHELAQRLGVEAGEFITLQVSDSGTGMDQASIERAIEPYYTTKPAGTGPGLGLSSAHGIISSFGGCLAITSQPGQGTTVTVSLPAVSAATDHHTATPLRVQVLGGRETILIVEDDPTVLGLVRDSLRHRGYLVLTAVGGDDALRLAQAHSGPIDLLLSDVVLPQIRGPALAAQLLLARRAMRVVLMSGYPADAFSVNREIANTAFLAKPFTIDELLRTVRAALDMSRPAQI